MAEGRLQKNRRHRYLEINSNRLGTIARNNHGEEGSWRAYEVGAEEIRFVVPTNQQPGNWPLFFNSGSCPDGSGVPGTCNANLVSGSSSPYVLLPVD